MSMLAPQTVQKDGVTILHFGAGPHTFHEAEISEITQPVLAASKADPPKVIVDLSEVEFFGSSFIEIMFRLWKRLSDRSGNFALAGLSSYCKEVLNVTNLDKLWMSYDTVDEALAAMKAGE
ncbi:MAG: STAS domain-containing protein [Planctomycetaceae bacterium]|nr:STAS domain-containing protein [Planctomycetaceae bacterium]